MWLRESPEANLRHRWESASGRDLGMALPEGKKIVVIGAGIHGLSTACHLAVQLKSGGQGSGEDVIVLDKTSIGAGASGIACGVVRNNYFQPAMRELMASSRIPGYRR